MPHRFLLPLAPFLAAGVLLLNACAPAEPSGDSATPPATPVQTTPPPSADTAPTQPAALAVTASTSVVADFVRVVGGDRVQVMALVPPGTDAHTFAPTPQSIRQLSGSRALLTNGAGLEGWLPQVTGAAPEVPVYALTDGLTLQPAPEHAEQHAGEDAGEHAEHSHDHGDLDPHAWWDPILAAGYVDRVAAILSDLDPAGAADYQANAAAYRTQLEDLDRYARQQFGSLPPQARRVVTAHGSLNYFARRYGLEVTGAVIPGLSTEREPSARDLAALADLMNSRGARVILTENVTPDRLAQALAAEAGGVVAPPVYTDALGPAGSSGATYLGAFRANVDHIAGALREVQQQPGSVR